MLTYETGEPTIKHAIWKRLGNERGVNIVDIRILKRVKGDTYTYDGEPRTAKDDHIAVGVWLILSDTAWDGGIIDLKSFFELPHEFEMDQVRNQIDEIAEKVKEARVKAGLKILHRPGLQRREVLDGTGLRGGWPV